MFPCFFWNLPHVGLEVGNDVARGILGLDGSI